MEIIIYKKGAEEDRVIQTESPPKYNRKRLNTSFLEHKAMSWLQEKDVCVECGAKASTAVVIRGEEIGVYPSCSRQHVPAIRSHYKNEK